jgi:FlaA1/EpsC-like NDP-sugar epimerase
VICSLNKIFNSTLPGFSEHSEKQLDLDMSRSKNIFITGANRGIGLELTRQILDRMKPDNLIVTCRDPAEAKVPF